MASYCMRQLQKYLSFLIDLAPQMNAVVFSLQTMLRISESIAIDVYFSLVYFDFAQAT